MAYKVLSLKWRPQSFKDIVGQEHITQTLINAFDQNRIAQGYIFTGPRGVGKTTTARILAMALNKHHHALTSGATLQSIHFDRKALVEALHRHSKKNSIDATAILRDDIDLESDGWHRVSWGLGPFKLVNVGNCNQAIIPIEDDCDGV